MPLIGWLPVLWRLCQVLLEFTHEQAGYSRLLLYVKWAATELFRCFSILWWFPSNWDFTLEENLNAANDVDYRQLLGDSMGSAVTAGIRRDKERTSESWTAVLGRNGIDFLSLCPNLMGLVFPHFTYPAHLLDAGFTVFFYLLFSYFKKE